MSNEDLFRTSRMNVMRGANLMFMPGEFVFLQRDVQEFKRGTPVKVISVQAVRPGEYRYQILIEEKKMWAFESDLRHTAPGDSQTGPQNVISATQRMQTMTLSQRMASMADTPSRPNPAGAPPRMHNSTQAERMQRMLQTNRLLTLGASGNHPQLDPVTPIGHAAGQTAGQAAAPGGAAATAPANPLAEPTAAKPAAPAIAPPAAPSAIPPKNT